MKIIEVRRMTQFTEMVWFDGSNTVDVAQWLQGHGLEPQVTFRKSGGVGLSINGYTREIPAGLEGVWIDSQGSPHTQDEIDGNWTDQP